MEKESSSKRTLAESERHGYYRSHLVQYTLVLVTFVFSIWIISKTSDTVWKLAIISFLAVFYFIFGIFHHFEEGELSSNHVFEYFLIAVLVFLILYSLFLR